MSSDPRVAAGLGWLGANRTDDLSDAMAGRAPRTDATPEIERELLAATMRLASGDDERFLRGVQAAKQAGVSEERVIDLLLLAVAIVGPVRAGRAADGVRELFGRSSGTGTWTLAALEAEIPDGGGREIKAGGKSIAILRRGESIYAIQALCPHMRGPMAEGHLEGTAITCPLHSWTFDLKSGACQGMPETSIAIYPVRVERGKIFVQV